METQTPSLIAVASGLVPIYEDENRRRVVDARQLHAFLKVGRDFTTWIKGRLDKYGFAEGEDYSTQEVLSSPDLGSAKARPQIRVDYLLSLDAAKEIAMVENNARGREVRRYFIACERRLREGADSGLAAVVAAQGRMIETLAQSVRQLGEALRGLGESRGKAPALPEGQAGVFTIRIVPAVRAFCPEALDFMIRRRTEDPEATAREIFHSLVETAEETGWKVGSQASFYRALKRLLGCMEASGAPEL